MPKLPRSVLVLLPVLALTACGGAGGVNRDGPATPSATGAAPVSSAPPDTVATPTPAASTPPPAATRSPARPPLSSTTLPTPRPPVVKPSPPTDLVTRHVSGFVTRGGDGPCYGMVAEDGTEYALHGPDVGELRTGSFVTLRLTTLRARIDCGPGVPMSIVTD